MTPIHELLNRIRWDQAFSKASFEVGYYDRVAECIVRVPFERIRIGAEDHFGFEALQADGSSHSVPFHRVRAVWRDGELIWHRQPAGGR